MEVGNAGRSPYEVGFDDNAAGKSLNDNPYWNGEFTKLGSRRLSDDAREWENGFNSRIVRKVTAKDEAAWQSINPSRFKRKSNRYYK